jgi:hypothetical protein
MVKHLVIAPKIEAGQKIKGPASYFPSIEKTYGRPIQDWLDIAAKGLGSDSHMKVVELLKLEHGLGHGHANAIVAFAKAALSK